MYVPPAPELVRKTAADVSMSAPVPSPPIPPAAAITTVPLGATMSTSVSPASVTSPAVVEMLTAVAELLVVCRLPTRIDHSAVTAIVPLPASITAPSAIQTLPPALIVTVPLVELMSPAASR